MGKKKTQVRDALESSVKPLLEIKFDTPLFALVAHPSKPILALGLANGYVFLLEYDVDQLKANAADLAKKDMEDTEDTEKAPKLWTVESLSKDGPVGAGVKLLWRTKRHKGSVRAMCFSADGEEIYTIGSDGVLKKAQSMSGKVVKKCTIEGAPTKIYKSEAHPFLVIGDEEGDVRMVDSESLMVKNVLRGVHEDAVNGIVPLKHKSAYQFVSIGSTTVSTWDIRKEKVKITSENQEDEILSACFVDPEVGETLLCGMGEGIATVWKQSKNDFTDQISRIKIAKDESIDCMISTLQNDDCCWAGCSSGDVYKIDAKRGKLVESRVHSFTDEVGFLDLDCEYRLVTGGMDKLKLWGEEAEEEEDVVDEAFPSSDDSDDDDDDDGEEFQGFDDEPEQPEQEEQAEPEPKSKRQKVLVSSKQLRNLQKHEHGIRRFDDL